MKAGQRAESGTPGCGSRGSMGSAGCIPVVNLAWLALEPPLHRLGQRGVDLRRAELGEQTAVDVDRLAGDVACVVRAEERDRAGDVGRVAHPPERDDLAAPVLRLLAERPV